MQIKVKYLNPDMPKLNMIDKGDWIDLRAAEDIEIKSGEFKLIPLGIAIELPKGYEAHIAPRSSTFKKFGLLQTNGVGVVDESYCGDSDEWSMPVLAFKDVKINKYERICQFRIVEKMPKCEFTEVLHLGNENRGGYGSTGYK